MGTEIAIEHGYVQSAPKRLKARIVTDMVTVTGTENLMINAVLADWHRPFWKMPHVNPEVVDLANCLIAMGANISGASSDRIVIEGGTTARRQLRGHARPIETGTFLVAAAGQPQPSGAAQYPYRHSRFGTGQLHEPAPISKPARTGSAST